MSPTPTPNPEGLPPEVCDGILAATIGSISFLIRVACSTEKHSLAYIARRTIIAGLCSLFVGLATKSYFHSDGMAFASAGCSGYASVELVEAGLAWLRRKGKQK
jgi:hypothetical protein